MSSLQTSEVLKCFTNRYQIPTGNRSGKGRKCCTTTHPNLGGKGITKKYAKKFWWQCWRIKVVQCWILNTRFMHALCEKRCLYSGRNVTQSYWHAPFLWMCLKLTTLLTVCGTIISIHKWDLRFSWHLLHWWSRILGPCSFVGWCQHFRETCCLYLPGWRGKARKEVMEASHSWPKGTKPAPNKTMTPPSGHFLFVLGSLPILPHWVNCLNVPYWSASFSHIPSLLLVPYPQPLLFRSFTSPLLPCLVTSALKMETACFSEMLASTYKTKWRQNPRLHHYNIYPWFICSLTLGAGTADFTKELAQPPYKVES
jgi:hypothetical protein